MLEMMLGNLYYAMVKESGWINIDKKFILLHAFYKFIFHDFLGLSVSFKRSLSFQSFHEFSENFRMGGGAVGGGGHFWSKKIGCKICSH